MIVHLWDVFLHEDFQFIIPEVDQRKFETYQVFNPSNLKQVASHPISVFLFEV